MNRILIANRGEIAIRIARAARDLGIPTVAIYSPDDADSLHVRHADLAIALPLSGAAAYLDQDSVLRAAQDTGCTSVHPGYGFLSENAAFAGRCGAAGLRFIGPTPETLELFGDKSRARALAQELGVPVMPGTSEPTSLAQAKIFASEHGAIMVKALSGGGGRGMRAVHVIDELDEAYERCRSEALQAFGDDELYVEKLLTEARHIEIQIVGDGSGVVCHLWERDCTIQRRHQKVIEIAPSPTLKADLRDLILQAATLLASHVGYQGLGTFEFLVRGDAFWFMEANPRLQVEHTITEEITGVDLVQTQIRIALGASLADVGLSQPPAARGFAIQARINLETILPDGTTMPRAGTLDAFAPPSGPDVRIDTYGYAGYQTSLRYDSLLAKVIVRAPDFALATGRLSRALSEFRIDGAATNIPLLGAIVRHPLFASGDYDTGFIGEHLAELLDASGALPSLAPPPIKASAGHAPLREDASRSENELAAPMHGTIVSLDVAVGDVVRAGDRVGVLEAMKMEHAVYADRLGTVTSLLIALGDSVEEGAALLVLDPLAEGAALPEQNVRIQEGGQGDWSPEVDEIMRRRAAAREMGGPTKTARQHAQGKLNVRERIDLLADPGTFNEIGGLTGFGAYDADGALIDVTPANFVAGTADIDGRRVTIGADDFTLRGGSGDGAIHEKQQFLERYAREMKLPVVRLLDGASGGGSVKIAMERGFHYVPVNPGWDAIVDTLSLAPVVAACLGPVVGLGAARLVMSHLAIMVDGIGQIFTAGPPIVQGSTGETLDKESLGGAAVHRDNGIVERIVQSEAEAFDVIRRFLSYLPGNVFELPPIRNSEDPTERRDAELLSAIPRNSRFPYRIDPILQAIFDNGSVFPYAEYGGATVTALARLDGHPVGVVAGDPYKGATMSVEGALALTRLVDLCETFHLPLVSLTDQGGVSIGLAAEKRGTLRYGARAISAVYQARIPQAELILRRVFGVGGAGIVNRHRSGRTWAWPSGIWGSLPAKGGIEAAFRAQLEQSDDPEKEIERLRHELEVIDSPFRTAERFGVQDVIDPRESRPLLCDWVRDAYRLLPQMIGRPSFGCRP